MAHFFIIFVLKQIGRFELKEHGLIERRVRRDREGSYTDVRVIVLLSIEN